jgi:hypothetical protein
VESLLANTMDIEDWTDLLEGRSIGHWSEVHDRTFKMGRRQQPRLEESRTQEKHTTYHHHYTRGPA